MEPRTYTSEYHDLVALCNAQSEELAKCRQALVDAYNERDEGHAALRAIVDEVQQGHPGRPDYISREARILAIAKKALKGAD